MESIRNNLDEINKRIANAALRSNRNPSDIKLVAVSKRIPSERIQEAIDSGQLRFGENYTQEAFLKIPRFDKNLSWHFIGHLQSNKAKIAAELFQVIETVDSLKLAKALSSHLEKINKSIAIFLQINIGGESRKSGVQPEKAEKLLMEINNLPNLKIKGLMTIPPYYADPELVRPYFRQMQKLCMNLQDKKLIGQHGKAELSMGMSGDFEVAIEEGATLVRVGTAIFGKRDS